MLPRARRRAPRLTVDKLSHWRLNGWQLWTNVAAARALLDEEIPQMKMTQEELPGGVLKVVLAGSLDIPGAATVELPMSVIAGRRDRVMLDFGQVDFLASIGVRVIVKLARTIGNRGGRVVLVKPNEAARRVLTSTGVDSIVTIIDDEAAAEAAFA